MMVCAGFSGLAAAPLARRAAPQEVMSAAGRAGLHAVPLSCSPFQAAGANILLLAIERLKSTAVRQGKRHDHENDG
jgi:hypothetical protein